MKQKPFQTLYMYLRAPEHVGLSACMCNFLILIGSAYPCSKTVQLSHDILKRPSLKHHILVCVGCLKPVKLTLGPVRNQK